LLIQEVKQLFVLGDSSFVFEEEMELLENVNQENFTGVVLTSEEHVLVFLVELSYDLGVNSLLELVLLDLWREESISILLWLGHERFFVFLNLAVIKQVLSLL